MIERVEVVDTASRGDLASVKQLMGEVGFDVIPARQHHPVQDQERVGEAIPWIVTVVLAAPIAAFFTSIATEAGKDAHTAIKRWVLGLSRAGGMHGEYGEIEIIDREGSRISIREASLPEEAITALLDIDWSSLRGKTLTWSDEYGWVDSTWYWETVLKPRIFGSDGKDSRPSGPSEPRHARPRHHLPPPWR